MLDSAGVRAAGDAFVWGVGGVWWPSRRPAGRAGCVDRGVAGRVGGVAAAGGPGLLELLAAAEHGRAGCDGEGESGRAGRTAAIRGAAAAVGLGVSRVGSRGIAAAAWRWWPPPTSASRSSRLAAGAAVADLAGAPGTVASRVQVFDLPSFSLAVTEYQMMRRSCGCGHATTAGRAGRGAGRTDLLRPERDRRGDPAGQPGRARDRTHRGPDVHAARGGGVHRVHLLAA